MNEEFMSEVEPDPERNKAVMQEVIARSFIRCHGDKAILMAMAEMLDEKARRPEDWRKIIDLIARFQNGDE